MDPVSDQSIDEVYQQRRLKKLRELAIDFNEQFNSCGKISYTAIGGPEVPLNTIKNALITDIDNHNEHYLYFALRQRVLTFEFLNFKIPEEVMYGPPYDDAFKYYLLNYLIMKTDRLWEFSSNWLPYVMLMNSSKLYQLYLNMFNQTKPELLITSLKSLLRGIPRDKILEQAIELLPLVHHNGTLSAARFNMSNIRKVYHLLLPLLENGDFSVLDIVYLILANDASYLKPEGPFQRNSNLLEGFQYFNSD